ETGLLVPTGDQAALSRTLATLLGNEPLRIRLGVNAKIAAQRFSTETMLGRTSDVLFRFGHRMSGLT
ncbi:MAG TPA: glycosyltransferase family 4 protein, partial [Candidatus Paceibacterota bacterium]